MDNILKDLSERVPRDDSEYLADDGLIHCRRCNGAREIVVKFFGEQQKVRCICKCKQDELAAEREADKRETIEKNRRACFRGSKLIGATFSGSDDSEGLMKGRNYAKHFAEMRRLGKGLLFYGPVGTGKSHIAACIANEVINQGYLARMTNISTMVNELQASFDGRAEYIYNLQKYDLLIIDDFGIERASEYMNEQVFNIVDSRISSGLPMIVTTNLSIEDMANAPGVDNRRVYQRILEHCHPVEITGASRRLRKMKNDFGRMEQLLKGE